LRFKWVENMCVLGVILTPKIGVILDPENKAISEKHRF